MIYNQEEQTIVALSTPVGKGAISIVRLSGKDSYDICQRHFSRSIQRDTPRVASFGTFISAGDKEPVDQVVLTYFKGPNSYTGEDIVEIACHCNSLIIDKIISEVINDGARIARPGEFTERAFFNQKIDLTQAEAVAGIIESKTRRSLSQSMKQLEGKLSEKILHIKSEIIEIASLIEISLDFNEDDVEIYEAESLAIKTEAVLTELDALIKTYGYGRLIKEGAKLIILGKPNVGKSSLLNMLVQKDRAIVSEQPGTTRDYIEESIEIGGIPVQIVDTAGIRDTSDKIEEEGVLRALKHVETADILMALFESHAPADKDDLRMIEAVKSAKDQIPVLLVINKIDLGEDIKTTGLLKKLDVATVRISAKNNLNIDELQKEIMDILTSSDSVEEEEVIITNSRHKAALSNARNSVDHFYQGLNHGLDEVVLASELRSALDYLGTIVGETTSEDLLNHIFGQFCIGK